MAIPFSVELVMPMILNIFLCTMKVSGVQNNILTPLTMDEKSLRHFSNILSFLLCSAHKWIELLKRVFKT